jgi:hypothetical protein
MAANALQGSSTPYAGTSTSGCDPVSCQAHAGTAGYYHLHRSARKADPRAKARTTAHHQSFSKSSIGRVCLQWRSPKNFHARKSSAFTAPLRKRSTVGSRNFARRLATDFPNTLPLSAKTWPCMAAMGKPCPNCGTAIQRICYADNETNYSPRCQTGGKLLADRSLSLLLKKDWPKTLEELEELRQSHAK